jgi:hypothetical protein
MADAPSQAAIYLARLAVTVVVVFIVLGFVWYGFSLEVHNRIWRNFADRLGGPMTFRFILQPSMALIAALHDGVKDARLGRSPYFWTILHDAKRRGERLGEGSVSTARIVLIALGMDVIYQYRVLNEFYPGEAVLVAMLLAFIPYVLLRGPIARLASNWVSRPQSN